MTEFPTLPGITSTGGVSMTAPPASMLSDINRLVTAALADVPDGQHGQLVGIATRTGDRIDVNLALAVKAGGRVTVAAWMGKSWGEPVAAGVVGRVGF